MRRGSAGLFVVVLLGAWLAVPTHAVAVANCGGEQPDFNGDGRADTAVGAPEDSSEAGDAGSVHVFYGAGDGLGTADDEIFSQSDFGGVEAPEAADHFGHALATGDFDGDGFTDLAVSAPLENSALTDTGVVHVLYGSPGGITTEAATYLHQDASGVGDSAESLDNFGRALAAGDFDGDGRCDLGVGVSHENTGGAVHVFYGSSSGVSVSGDQLLHQSTTGMADVLEDGDGFGAALASSDFDSDGRDDLAVGVPLESIATSSSDEGAVHVIYGSSTGLTASGDQFIHQDTTGMADSADPSDEFGRSLATGDFDGDGREDLAIGVPDEGSEVGAIHVLYAASSGLTASGDQFIHQDVSGFTDSGEEDDGFGRALAAGDFDNDGRDDLAVGVPGETIDLEAEGAIHAIYGSSTGLSASGDQFIHQDTTGMADQAEEFDRFGQAIGAGDFDNDGRDDVVVGLEENLAPSFNDEGAIHVIDGSSTGLTASGDQFLHRGLAEVAGDNSGDALFGGSFPGSPNP